MTWLIPAILCLAGIVNLMPVTGVLSGPRVAALYGVTVDSPDLAILMRHRAVLFAIVGSLLIAAAVEPRLRSVAIFAGLVSMVSFIALALIEGGYNRQIATVVRVDVVASTFLLIAAVLHWKGLP